MFCSDYYIFYKFFLFVILVVIINAIIILPKAHAELNGFENDFPQDSRLIGGKETKSHTAPYMISIQKQSSRSGKLTHFCGGVIINEHWILTAAHCLQSKSSAANAVLVAGAHNIGVKEKTTQIRHIDYYKIHDLYVGNISPYDIALIYTRDPFQWTNYVKPISLPNKNVKPTGSGTLFGWGSISSTEKPIYPNKLHSVEMPIITIEQCKQALGSMGINVHQTNLCTGPLNGGKGICQADSGGPLVQNNRVIGIVSWGRTPCGQKNSPSIFVQVSAFIDWIQKIQKQAPEYNKNNFY